MNNAMSHLMNLSQIAVILGFAEMKEKDPDRLSFSWNKYSHKNRNYRLPWVHDIKYNRKHTPIVSVHEHSHPRVNNMTGE